MRNYPLDAWYCAAWSGEVGSTALTRQLFGIQVMLFRQPDGRPVALEDKCPHRFAALHGGVQPDGSVQCPYHGLTFDGTGSCIANPHGPLVGAKVRDFPLAEHAGTIWIWPGRPEAADPALLPDLADHAEAPGQTRMTGLIALNANYALVVDNLLDLSHVEFLHPQLMERSEGRGLETKVKVGDRSVTMNNQVLDQPVSAGWRGMWDNAPARADKWSEGIWEAPSIVKLCTGWAPLGGVPKQEGITIYHLHLITPRSASQCHYFWSSTRRFHLDNPAFDSKMRATIELTFIEQDGPVIEQQQRNIGDGDLYDQHPVLLPTDRAAGSRNRIVKQMIARETAHA